MAPMSLLVVLRASAALLLSLLPSVALAARNQIDEQTQLTHEGDESGVTVFSDNLGAERANPCKGLGTGACTQHPTDCYIMLDPHHPPQCLPRTCAGIKGSDCRDLSGICKWEWHAEQNSGNCLNVVAPQPMQKGATAMHDNPCKDLDGAKISGCRAKINICLVSANNKCLPVSCKGIKGSDCRELPGHCKWNWNSTTSTGECLNDKPALSHNTCKGLLQSSCADPLKHCRLMLDNQLNKKVCIPKSCKGLYGSDCRELAQWCTWNWHKESGTGDCLDKAAEGTSSRTTTTTKSRACQQSAVVAVLLTALSAFLSAGWQ